MSKASATSAIAHVEPDRITVRGTDLCSALIGHLSFSDYALFLIEGERPRREKADIFNACLVALAEHGLVPSVQAARMTLAAAPEAIHGAVAAGLLGCGSVILGSSDVAGRMLSDILAEARSGKTSINDAARAKLTHMRANKINLPGFGHPVHRQEDPRATRLLEYARETGTYGDHCRVLEILVSLVSEVYGHQLPLNVSGAIPAVLLDVGFPPRALKGVPLIGRTASLLAHLLEEMDRPIGFAISSAAEHAVAYDGPQPQSASKDKEDV